MGMLEITPVSKKYAEDLTHRDYLGALMHLGIDRSLLGDILVQDTAAYLFCCERIVAYICENLFRIRHTQVQVKEGSLQDFSYEPKFEYLSGSTASFRLDAILSMVYKKSRSETNTRISSGLVYVNQKLIQNPSQQLKEGDVVSFRGFGKFQVESANGRSKKGKLCLTIKKFI
jgi:RNA-binding protein YlmH